MYDNVGYLKKSNLPSFHVMEIKAMQLKVNTLVVVIAKKGIVMEINNKKNYVIHIRIYFIMFLFAMCLTMNVFFCVTYNPYESLGKTAVIETGTIFKSIAANDDSNNTSYYRSLFLNINNYHTKTTTKYVCPISMIAAIPERVCQFLIRITVFYLILYILLPNGWTLINQKIRMDN